MTTAKAKVAAVPSAKTKNAGPAGKKPVSKKVIATREIPASSSKKKPSKAKSGIDAKPTKEVKQKVPNQKGTKLKASKNSSDTKSKVNASSKTIKAPVAVAKPNRSNAKKSIAANNLVSNKSVSSKSANLLRQAANGKSPSHASQSPASQSPVKSKIGSDIAANGPAASTKGNKASTIKSSKAVVDKTTSKKISVSPPPKPTNPKVVKKIRDMQSGREQRKDLAQSILVRPPIGNGASDITLEPKKDRLVLVVRDSYWIHASWDIMRQSVERAKAAMAEHWHTVKPILRVLKSDNSGTTNNAETILRDIEIHGGVRNWYIEVSEPPSEYRVLLGYVANNGRFHELVRSNSVSTPAPGSSDAVSEHWADIAVDAEHIYAISGGYQEEQESPDLREMFEERLKRPMGAPALAQFGSGAEGGMRRHRHFHFDLEAEMIVFGSTHPDAYVTLGGEPVKVRGDGTFSIRVPLPDRRQVLAATACTRDGVDEQTIVIAVERNTKIMEPLSKENEEQQ